MKQIFRIQVSLKPKYWFLFQKYLKKYPFEPDIPYYSKGALASHIIECTIKGNWERLKEIKEKFDQL